MARPRTFRPEEIAIPPDARPHRSWPPFMLEMAAHIGAYDTLRIVDALGGQDFVVAVNPARGPFPAIVGAEKSATLSHVYARERIVVPLGTEALRRARREPVLAAVRQGKLSVKEAAAMLRMRRTHLSRLINHTDEGTDCETPLLLPSRHAPRQLDMFAE